MPPPTPQISVIVPAFNGRSRYLTEAIQSILDQTCTDFELIIVDDASTDQTHDIIPSHPRITYFRRGQNGGPAAARNDGAKLAKGEFLAFMDQDDLWEPTFLEETVPILQAMADTAAVHTDGYSVNSKNEIIRYNRTIQRTDDVTVHLTKGHVLHACGSLFRKTHFDSVKGYDEKMMIWEDRDLQIRLGSKYPLHHIPKPLFRNRVYKHNVSSTTPLEKSLADRKYFLEKHAPACQQEPHLKNALESEWAMLHSDMGKYYLSQNQRKKARQCFRQSLRYSPFSRRTILRYLRSFTPFLPKHIRRLP